MKAYDGTDLLDRQIRVGEHAVCGLHAPFGNHGVERGSVTLLDNAGKLTGADVEHGGNRLVGEGLGIPCLDDLLQMRDALQLSAVGCVATHALRYVIRFGEQ